MAADAPSSRGAADAARRHAFLEFHHIDPYAIGGETTLVNLSLRCRAHNVHEAERLFGSFVPAVSREGRDAGRRLGSSTRPGASDAGQALRARGGAQALLSQTPGP